MGNMDSAISHYTHRLIYHHKHKKVCYAINLVAVRLSDETNFDKHVLKKNQIDNYYVPGQRSFRRFLCLAGGKVLESKLALNHQRYFFVVNFNVVVSSRANHSTNCCLKSQVRQAIPSDIRNSKTVHVW